MPANELTTNMFNSLIFNNNEDRRSRRKATNLDIVKHCLGVAPCYLEVEFQINSDTYSTIEIEAIMFHKSKG